MNNNRIPPASLVKEAIKKSGRFEITALGSSMTPIIWHRSRVLLDWVEPEKIKIGDIIVKGIDYKYIIHRVIRILKKPDEEGKNIFIFITKGDFLTRPDPFYDADEYLGKVSSISNKLISFNPNTVSQPLRRLCVWFSRIGSFFDRYFSFIYKLIYKIRILQIFYRTVFSFPVLLINTAVLFYYFLRRCTWKRNREL